MLGYISTREFLRRREKYWEARAESESLSYFSSVLKNFSSAYITQQCSRNKFFYFFYKMYRALRARTDDVGCVHCISTVHSCDVRRVLYGIQWTRSDQSRLAHFFENFITWNTTHYTLHKHDLCGFNTGLHMIWGTIALYCNLFWPL